jgi:hypothetical protein
VALNLRQPTWQEEEMAGKPSDKSQPTVNRSSEYMKGGKGRTDDVRGSRIYPASAPDTPNDAEVRTAQDFVKHRGPKPRGFKRAI